jgi:putative transposase
MPRITRGLVDGFIYHVMNRGNDKRTVFHKDLDYKSFTDLMEEGKSLYSVWSTIMAVGVM